MCKIHSTPMKIFAISGLGADKRVFEDLTLNYELTYIDWISPHKNENIMAYSKRLIAEYKIDNYSTIGIIGLSFGGLIATEISKIVKPTFTILISSVSTKDELSIGLRLLGKSKIIEFIPHQCFRIPKPIAHFMFGTKRKKMLNTILNQSDLFFTKWAIIELLNWQNKTLISPLIKISGTKDKLLPPKGINYFLIEKGEHFMIVDRAKEISTLLNQLLKKYDH